MFLPLLVFSQPMDLVLSSYNNQSSITALNSITLKNGFYIPAGKNVVLSIQGFPNLNSSPTGTQGYILKKVFKIPVKQNQLDNTRTVAEENQTIQYIDGFGKAKQIVEVMASPKYRDIVTYREYDALGREAVNYLPYTEQVSADGSYKTAAKSNQTNFYKVGGGWDMDVTKTGNPYSITVFENNPKGRPVQQGAPGSIWQPIANRGTATTTGRTKVVEYATNIGAGADLVKKWEIKYNGSLPIGATSTANYAIGMLSKIVIKDENWSNVSTDINKPTRAGITEEFSDIEDRVILKRLWEDETKCLDTYYIYDIYGNLCYIVPPGVTGSMFEEKNSDLFFNKYIYANHFDGKKRLKEKKSPGKGWEFLVYNTKDQEILRQDSLHRSTGQWIYTKYDAFGRISSSGIYTNTALKTQKAAQDLVDAHQINGIKYQWEERNETSNYTNRAFPISAFIEHTINYYDDYTFNGAATVALQPKSITKSQKTYGLPTGIKITNVDGIEPLLTINYYDDKGYMIQSVSQNHISGVDYITNTYSFSGELLSSKREHQGVAGQQATILTSYNYDHSGRLSATKKKINNQEEIIQSKLDYNEIGQLKQKLLHKENTASTFLDTIKYTYNERGWQLGNKGKYFTQTLAYDKPAGGTAQYNGAIAQQYWRYLPNETARSTLYSYDKLGRLIKGVSSGVVLHEEIGYDNLGNITTLKRDDATVPITYTYSGNQLIALSGGLNGAYTYDGNGNVLKDRMNFMYENTYLNLPRTVVKVDNVNPANSVNVSYNYSALGIKLRKTVKIGSLETQRDYIGEIEYSKVSTATSTIEVIRTEEGYLQRGNDNIYSYHYNLTDHLGNVRGTIQRTSANSATIIQKHDYYPFGKAKAIVTSGINKYLYNGKERQDEIGGLLDYGARYYDTEIGRWTSIDPISERYGSYSPYAYALNSPMNLVDPNGMWVSTPDGYYSNDPSDFGPFLNYLNSQEGGATMEQISGHIESSPNFSIGLSPVTVTSQGFHSGTWIGMAEAQHTKIWKDFEKFTTSIVFRTSEDIMKLETAVPNEIFRDKLKVSVFTDAEVLKSKNPIFNVKKVFNSETNKLEQTGISIGQGLYGVSLGTNGIVSQSTKIGPLNLSLGMGLSKEGLTISTRGSINVNPTTAHGLSANYKMGIIGYSAVALALTRGASAVTLPFTTNYAW